MPSTNASKPSANQGLLLSRMVANPCALAISAPAKVLAQAPSRGIGTRRRVRRRR